MSDPALDKENEKLEENASEEEAPALMKLWFQQENFVEVDLKKAGKKSKVLGDMIKHLEMDLDKFTETAQEGPVCITGSFEALQKVAEWMMNNYDKPSPKPINEFEKKIHLTEADNAFLDVNNALLADIMRIANFFDIDDLIEITSQKVANMLKDKTVEQMRAILKLPDDLTPDEKEQIREKHAWAMTR